MSLLTTVFTNKKYIVQFSNTLEELYLTILEIARKLSLRIGHAIAV